MPQPQPSILISQWHILWQLKLHIFLSLYNKILGKLCLKKTEAVEENTKVDWKEHTSFESGQTEGTEEKPERQMQLRISKTVNILGV